MSSPSHPQSPGDPAGFAQPSTAEIPVVQPAAAPVTKQLPPHPGATAFGAHTAPAAEAPQPTGPVDFVPGLPGLGTPPPAARPPAVRSAPPAAGADLAGDPGERRRRAGGAADPGVPAPAGPRRPGRGRSGRALSGAAAVGAGARLRPRVAVGRRPAVVGLRHGGRPRRAAGPALSVLAGRAARAGPRLAGGRRGPGRPGGVLAARRRSPARTATAVSCSPPPSAASVPRCGSGPSATDRSARPGRRCRIGRARGSTGGRLGLRGGRRRLARGGRRARWSRRRSALRRGPAASWTTAESRARRRRTTEAAALGRRGLVGCGVGPRPLRPPSRRAGWSLVEVSGGATA